MKLLIAMALINAGVLICSFGCGGGSGSSPTGGIQVSSMAVAGIWSGPAEISTGKSFPSQVLKVEFFQSGATLTGTSLLDVQGIEHIGTVTGVISGSTVSFSADYGLFGTMSSSFTAKRNTMTGSSQRTVNGVVVDSGASSLVKQTAMSTPNITGNYTGAEDFSTLGLGTTPVLLTITQTLDSLTLTGKIGGNPVAGSGAIVGNTVLAQVIQTGTANSTTISGSVAPVAQTAPQILILANYSEPGSNTGNNGVSQSGPLNLSNGK